MKRKISLLLCALMMVLGLAGCSGKEEAGIQVDTVQLQEMSEFIISNFSQMGDEEFAQFENISSYQLDYTMMQSGLSISGEDFVGIIASWKAAEVECGEYLSHGEYTVEEKSDSIVVSTLAQYEEREAVISFSFNEKAYMESMDVSAKFSIGEILTKAGLNTLLGMGTVFAVLIFLAFLIGTMKYIPVVLDKLSKKPQAAPVKETVVAAPVETVEETDDLELIAVITAAIAAQEGTSTDGFVVRSIRRRPSNNWN